MTRCSKIVSFLVLTWATAEDQRNFDKVCSTTPGSTIFVELTTLLAMMMITEMLIPPQLRRKCSPTDEKAW